jgi:transposase
VDDRAALSGILFVLKTGIPWEDLPQEMGCGCGMTCWRRLRDWQAAGVWDRLHELLLSELNAADKIDWSRAAVDSSTIRAVGGGKKTGPNPTDRSKPGSKHHVITDGGGVPLAVELSGANQPDIKHLLPLVVNVPPVRGKPGRPRSRPEKAYADRAYDSEPARGILRWLGIEPFLAKRRTEHGTGMGKFRWVVERTNSWFHKFRRIRVRYERRDDIHEGFLGCAKSLICLSILML